MANQFVTMANLGAVSEDILIAFQNALTITATSWKGYEKDMLNQSWDTGALVNIPLPVNYVVGDGAVITGSADTEENSTQLQLTFRKHIEAQFDSKELTYDAETQFRKRFIEPHGRNLANIVDFTVGQEIGKAVYNHIGTPGTKPNAYKSAALTAARMNKLGIPMADRYLGFGEDSFVEMISSGTLQNSFDMQLTRDINRQAQLGRIADMQSYHSIYMPQQTAGIGDSSATPSGGYVAAGNVKTTVTSGNTIVVENLQASDTGVFQPGDKITIAGVFSVNPLSLESTGELIQFTVTNSTAVDSDASGEATITVSPAIVSSATSPYRNISNTAGIPGGAASAITLATANTGVGSTVTNPYTINVGYIPEAVLFAAPPLQIPEDVQGRLVGQAKDPDTGVSIRMVAKYDIINDRTIIRTDILFGIKINADRIVGLLG